MVAMMMTMMMMVVGESLVDDSDNSKRPLFVTAKTLPGLGSPPNEGPKIPTAESVWWKTVST
jgi:hypothetical protein